MTETRIRVKQNARLILKNNWFKAIMILIIINLLAIAINTLYFAYCSAFQITPINKYLNASYSLNEIFISTIVTAIFALLTILLTTPLSLGQAEWYWKLTERKPQGVEGIFEWFGSLRLYAKSIWLNLYIGIRALPWALLTLGIPFCIIYASFYLFESNPKNTQIALLCSLLMIFGFGLLLCGIILYFFIMTRYFLAKYLLVEDNKRKVTECVRNSIKYSKGKRGEIFIFQLSFIGWLLLSSISYLVFIGLFVLPYYYSSCAVYAKYLIFSARVPQGDIGSNTIEFNKQHTIM
jgi:uncharacterized membrane protein